MNETAVIRSGGAVDTTRNGNFTRGVRDTDEKMSKGLEEVSTGLKEKSFNGKQVASNTKQILNNQQVLDETSNTQEQAELIKTRLELMASKAKQVNQISQQIRLRVVKARDPSGQDLAFGQYCNDQLKQLEKIMNAKDADGRYLFGGAETKAAPVDLSLAPTPSIGSPLSDAYYLGDKTGPLATSLREGDEFITGALANETSIQELVYILKMGVTVIPDADPDSLSSQKLFDMLDRSGNAVKTTSELFADIGTQLEAIESELYNIEIDRQLIEETVADMVETNLAEAIVNIQQAIARGAILQTLVSQASKQFREFAARAA